MDKFAIMLCVFLKMFLHFVDTTGLESIPVLCTMLGECHLFSIAVEDGMSIFT